MLKFLGGVCLAFAVCGCTGLELARLAPPGIIRYERIADEKKPNPAITARVAERRVEEKPKFPKLGETSAGGAKRSAIPNRGVEAKIARLESERDNLDTAVETDKLESSAAMLETSEIEGAAKDLSKAIDDEKNAAARERRDNDAFADVDEK